MADRVFFRTGLECWAKNLIFSLLFAVVGRYPVMANVAPVIDGFSSTGTWVAPGGSVGLSLSAHDPDCLQPPCVSGCGAYIRTDLFTQNGWGDNSGRPAGTAFTNLVTSPSGSPWQASSSWLAPAAEGIYTVTATVSDSGGLACDGRKTTISSLSITVSSTPPPVIDAMTVTPATVGPGGTALVDVQAHDPLGRALTYEFSATAGSVSQAGPAVPQAQWTAPLSAGVVTLRCAVRAAGGPAVVAQATATVAMGRYAGTLGMSDIQITRTAPAGNGSLVFVDAVNGLVGFTPGPGSGRPSWIRNGLKVPVSVAVKGTSIFVLERGESRIATFTTAGVPGRSVPIQAAGPSDLALGPGSGEVAVADTLSGSILILSLSDGHLIRPLGQGQLRSPNSVAVFRNRIAVADSALKRVLVLDSTGALLSTIGTDAIVTRPQAVTFDDRGDLILADSFTGDLLFASLDGTIKGQLGGYGASDGQLVNPTDVKLLTPSLLGVASASTGRVELFELLGTRPVLAPPVNLLASDAPGDDGGVLLLRWSLSPSDPAYVTTYRIDRAATETGAFSAVATVQAGSSQFIDSSAIDGVCYRYRVAAGDGVSEALSLETPCAYSRNDLAPAAPASVTAQPLSPSEIWVRWTPVSARDLVRYDVLLSSSGVPRTVSAGSSQSEVVLSSLSPDVAYNIAVRAVDSASNVSSDTATTARTYPDAAPPAPVDLQLEDTGKGGTILARWNLPESRVPVAGFKVTSLPQVAGWPAPLLETSSRETAISGLVNKLGYSVAVVATTPWGRASAPTYSRVVTPTGPARELPVIEAAGWAGPGGEIPPADASGFEIRAGRQTEPRELRFQYRTSRTQAVVSIPGSGQTVSLPDTSGAWTDGKVSITPAGGPQNTELVLAVKNPGFPDAGSEMAFRNLDFVPLPATQLEARAYNSVADLSFGWREDRKDLTVSLWRYSPGPSPAWQEVPCNTPHFCSSSTSPPLPCSVPGLGLCRDTFRQNGESLLYRLAPKSPAGWTAPFEETRVTPAFQPEPPPVTDAVVERIKTGSTEFWRVRWTPVSAQAAAGQMPAAASSYRIYVMQNGRLGFVREVSAPPVDLPITTFNPVRQAIIIRSVDSLGRESQ